MTEKKLYIITPKNHQFMRLTVTKNLTSLLKGSEKFFKKGVEEEYECFGGIDYTNSFLINTKEPNKYKTLLKTLYGKKKVFINKKITGKTDLIDGDFLEDIKDLITEKDSISLQNLLFEQTKEGENQVKIKEINIEEHKLIENNKTYNIDIVPTEEQLLIKEVLTSKEEINMKINAFAGTGKTSTLKIIANEIKDNILYLAFNAAIAQEAKRRFPSNVTVMTTHSMALYGIKHFTKLSMDNVKQNDYKPKELSENVFKDNKDYDFYKSVLELFDIFCNSKESFELFFNEEDEVFEYTKELWNKMESGEIDFTHNFYLKKFDLLLQNGEIKITKYNTIMLDEAQDTNEVTLSIFKNIQAPKKIIVGDQHQQIYRFRGSINLMEQFEGEEYYLTETFRYNKTIADKTTQFLNNYKWETNSIVSHVEDNTNINTVAYLFRTNAGQIKCIADFLKNGVYFKTIKNPEQIFTQILDLVYFKRGEKEKIKVNTYLLFFSNMNEVLDYAENINDIGLKNVIKILQEERYTLEDLKNMLQKTKEYYQSKIKTKNYISTIHSAKGLEWDRVVIGEDFNQIKKIMEERTEGEVSLKDWKNKDNLNYLISPDKKNAIIEELNLLYVAITRGKQDININEDNMCFFEERENKLLSTN